MINIIKQNFYQIKSTYIANKLIAKNFLFDKDLSYDLLKHLNSNHKIYNDFNLLNIEQLKYLSTRVNPDKLDKRNQSLILQYINPEIDFLTFKKVLANSQNPSPDVATDLLNTLFKTNRKDAEILPDYEQQKEKLLSLINHPNFNIHYIYHGFKGNYTFFEELMVHFFNYPNIDNHERLFSDLSQTRLKEVMTLDNLTNAYKKWINLFNNQKTNAEAENLYQNIIPLMEKQSLEKLIKDNTQPHKKVKI